MQCGGNHRAHQKAHRIIGRAIKPLRCPVRWNRLPHQFNRRAETIAGSQYPTHSKNSLHDRLSAKHMRALKTALKSCHPQEHETPLDARPDASNRKIRYWLASAASFPRQPVGPQIGHQTANWALAPTRPQRGRKNHQVRAQFRIGFSAV